MFSSRDFLHSLTTEPGIYQMRDSKGQVLYVGKARNLKKRLSSYFQKSLASARLVSLVKQIAAIDVIVTRNENEALLLENQLIKKFTPRYNILMRDDKSYSFIVLTDHAYPRLLAKRGKRQGKDHYFGPYPSAIAVRATLKLMQKVFRLRTCRDSFYQHRSRPCLLYQIKKCSAPCVGYVTSEAYKQDVKNAELLLSGKNQEVIAKLIQQMEAAAREQDFEQAAKIRDQITHLKHVQTEQVVSTEKGNIDVITLATKLALTAVQILSIRDGFMLGNQIFYPSVPEGYTAAEILSSFIPQYYIDHELPDEIIVPWQLPDEAWIENALIDMSSRKIKINHAVRGKRAEWIKMAEKTAIQAVLAKSAATLNQEVRLQELQQLLQLNTLPQRMECFDISHSVGEATVASCVVFNSAGPQKNAYRRFNITDVTPGDDYGAIRQALTRRYKKIQAGEEPLPDILFIDGGKGQLHQAEKVLQELGIHDLTVVAIAKGPSRKPGFEQLFMLGKHDPLAITAASPALHLIQQIRDEAHRFAITGHRQRRAKTRQSSPLENIPGVGAKKRRDLLRYLGGLQEVKRASIEELAKVPGISSALAAIIYQELH